QQYVGGCSLSVPNLQVKANQLIISGVDGPEIQCLDDNDVCSEQDKVGFMLVGAELFYRQVVDANDFDPVLDEHSRGSRCYVDIVFDKLTLVPQIGIAR